MKKLVKLYQKTFDILKTMIFSIAINIFGFFVFLFLFWRRLKEDYVSGQIFTTGFFIFFGLIVFYILSKIFFPGWWFWITFGGLSLGLISGVVKNHLRFYETIEAAILGILSWNALFFLGDSVRYTSLSSFIAFAVLILLLGFFYFLDTHYKNFSWYKSGRVGLSGLLTLATFFVFRSVASGFTPNIISFAPKFEMMISGAFAFILFLLIYNLARSK